MHTFHKMAFNPCIHASIIHQSVLSLNRKCVAFFLTLLLASLSSTALWHKEFAFDETALANRTNISCLVCFVDQAKALRKFSQWVMCVHVYQETDKYFIKNLNTHSECSRTMLLLLRNHSAVLASIPYKTTKQSLANIVKKIVLFISPLWITTSTVHWIWIQA